MSHESDNQDISRRRMLETTGAGAIGISAGMFSTSLAAQDDLSTPGDLRIVSSRSIPKNTKQDLQLQFKTSVDLVGGSKTMVVL